MVGLTLIGNALKGAQGGGVNDPTAPTGAVAAIQAAPAARVTATLPARVTLAAAGTEAPAADLVDDSLPTGSIDRISGLQRPNPAAYGDAAKQGSSLIITGAEAINYLAGNTLRREGPGLPPHFTYFAPRGVVADGTEREFVVRGWDRNRPDLCEPRADGAPVCGPIQILLDAKQELQGGRLGTVTIGTTTAELIKGNALRVPPHIPFIDSTVALDGAASGTDPARSGWDALVDHTAAVSTEAGTGRHFVFYGVDNRRLDVQPIEAAPGAGRAVRVAVGHWKLSKATLCESAAAGPAQVCFKPQEIGGGAMRLVPVAKGGQALRAMALPETRARAVAED